MFAVLLLAQLLPTIAVDSLPRAAREAIEPAQRAAVARPDDANAVGTFARTLHAWEQWSTAHEAYTRAIGLAPKTVEWRYLDAAVLQRLARPSDAVTRLREVLALSPDYLPARLKLAEALLDAGELEESKTRFASLTKEAAARPAAEVGLGRIAAAERRHEAAIEHLQRAVALFPELGAAHYALALSYRALGRSDEARAALAQHEKFGAAWPALEDPILTGVTMLRDDAGALQQRGVKLAQAGDVDGAIAAFESALARDPSRVQAHADLLSLYGRTRNWSKAEEHYRAIVHAGAALADVHYNYGVLLAMQEKWDAAIDAYRQALILNPLHAQAHNNLGQALERLRRLDEAAAAYRDAVASQPRLRIARFNLARMLIALDKPHEAIVELQKIIEPRDAEAARYVFALSVASLRAGRKEDAVKWAREAKQLALQFGQNDLAAAIDRELASLKQQ